jgi:hypothetical protein
MTADGWMRANLPKNKATLSLDAVEILIKMAWEAAVRSGEQRPKNTNTREIIGPYAIEELD